MSRGSDDTFDLIEPAGRIMPQVPRGLPWLTEAARVYDGRPSPAFGSSRRLLRAVDWVDRRSVVDIPWCGLFVGHCIRTAFPRHRLPTIQFRARPWLGYGREAGPQLGAILLFWLRWPGSPFGHVGFYWGEDSTHFHVLGGNQHETILIERFPKERLIGCRWPYGAALSRERRRRRPEGAKPFEHAEQEEARSGARVAPD